MKTVARVTRELLDDPNLSERTRHIYSEILRQFLNYQGYRNICDIDRNDIKEFLSHWDDAKHKTYNLSHLVVNRLFNLARTQEYIKHNPASKIGGRRAQEAQGETRQETVKLLSNH